MGKNINILKFGGIAPRFGDRVPLGWATNAVNLDVSGGKLACLSAARQAVPPNLYPMNSLAWPLNPSLTVQLAINNGILQKTIEGTTVNCGQVPPEPPVVALNGGGNVTGNNVTYFVTTTRIVNGSYDESGPGAVSQSLTASNNTIRVTQPSGIVDPNVSLWNIYRIDGSTAAYLLVASLPIATQSYNDSIADANLGIACPTDYTSDQGNEITFAAPGYMEGFSTEIYHGMLFAWNETQFFWNDPGLPDAWPSFYNINWNAAIKRIVPFGGSVAVLTGSGPFRLDGTNPELLIPSTVFGKEPCNSSAAYPFSMGVLYLGPSGLVLFNLLETVVLSDLFFGEDWFSANLNYANIQVIENERYIYVTDGVTTLMGDYRSGMKVNPKSMVSPYWTYLNPAQTEWTWKSGDISPPSGDTTFLSVILEGTGKPTLTVFMEGQQIAQRVMNLDVKQYRQQRLPLDPQQTDFALQIQIDGGATDTVKEIIVEAQPG